MPSNDLKLIGIGASAGGLESIQLLVGSLPRALNGTAIIIAQHLSPDYKSMLVELLARKTKIPVEHIVSGDKLVENTIYISPPSDDVAVKNGKFYLKKPADIGAHPSIDVLFLSLAKEYKTNACGIVLSGTGKDGSKGLMAIKRSGGLAIVQDPSTAKYSGMPDAAIETGVADHVLSPERIGQNLEKLISRKLKPSGSVDEDNKQATEPIDTFPQIFDLLERRIGIDFSDYKTSTLIRRLDRRIQEKNFDSEDEYLLFIKKNPEELDQLFEALLIGVTSFFRDKETFNEIETTLLRLIQSKKKSDSLRLWVPGCATGEEAYTYAILAKELMAKTGKSFPLQIFGTDIDLKALHKARTGIYTKHAVDNVPKKLLHKYFKKINDDKYEVHKDIRRMVLFSRHDLTANPPFLRMDLISCRNLLIYFNMELQTKVLPLFYYALCPSGVLVLGKSENIGKFQNLFSPLQSSHKIFEKKNIDNKQLKFPSLKMYRQPRRVNAPLMIEKEDLSIAEMVKETLYNSADHPFVVVDDSMEIVEINGDIEKFIKFKPGSASLNISKLIASQLQIELRAVTTKAVSEHKATYGKIRRLDIGKTPIYIRIVVKPLQYAQPNNPYYMITFEKLDLDTTFIKMGKGVIEDQESPRVIELEHELDATKEHMNSLLEELETSNEELQALNEEMQASNEELQASNEELETSNEELQATNEELENAYSELSAANEEIEQQKDKLQESANNLSTLLNNTLVGFILIDREYRVLAANKIASATYKKLFNVSLRENGSYIKLLPSEIVNTFLQNFKKALAGEQIVTEERFAGKKGQELYFDINYTPVTKEQGETEARYIALSFVDITNRKTAEFQLLNANKLLSEEKQFMSTLTGSLPSFVWTANTNGDFSYCNNYFISFTGMTQKQITKNGWEQIIHPEDIHLTESLWAESLKNGNPMTVEHRIRNKNGDYRWHITLAEAVRSPDKSVRMWVGSSTEIESIKQRKEMEQDVKRLEKQKNDLMYIGHIKDEFISMASHQLRTPASAVKQYLGIVMDELAGPINPDQLQYLQTAYNSNERQLTVINDLLKTAQLDANGYTINRGNHDVADLVKQVVEEMQPVIDLNKQKVVVECKELIRANFDYEDIKLAITNLLENACKYSYPKGEIIIIISKKNRHVQISIQDNGVGIDIQNQDRIFEKFTRIDNDLSDTVTGTGLGLYWVKRIVDLHNGRIDITSKPKAGSKFTVILPR